MVKGGIGGTLDGQWYLTLGFDTLLMGEFFEIMAFMMFRYLFVMINASYFQQPTFCSLLFRKVFLSHLPF